MSHTKEIQCEVCEGTGKVPDHDLGKLIGNQWVVEEKKVCWSCGGSGHARENTPEKPEDAPNE